VNELSLRIVVLILLVPQTHIFIYMYIYMHCDSSLTVVTRMGVSEMLFLRTQQHQSNQPTHLI